MVIIKEEDINISAFFGIKMNVLTDLSEFLSSSESIKQDWMNMMMEKANDIMTSSVNDPTKSNAIELR